jgi:uncharacterized LabA/DUF88 family protein
MASIGVSTAPYYSWMVFIDGENYTIRGQEVAKQNNIILLDGRYYCPNTFLWIPSSDAHKNLNYSDHRLAPCPIRSSYYTSVVGDDVKVEEVRKMLWDLKFNPVVFKKGNKSKKTKGVDITLTKDLLINAFSNNYDVAVLFTADGDYVPVVEEIRRMGRIVVLAFFDGEWLNQKLKLSCDSFFDITPVFIANWSENK